MTKVVVLPDIHVPCEHKESVDAVLQFIKVFKPDILVQLGDFCDFNSLSTHPIGRPSEFVYLEDELSAARKLLDRIDAACPAYCQKYLIGGNHEDRYLRYKTTHLYFSEQISRSLHDFSDWWVEYELAPHPKDKEWKVRKNWHWCNYGEWVDLGKLILTHGWASGPSSTQDISKRFPGKNVLFGHTHQHLVYGCMDEAQRPIEVESIGALSRFDLSYLRGKPPYNWTRGFSYIYMRDDGTFTKSFIHIIEGRFIVNGREYIGSNI